MTRRLLYLNGLAILGVVLYHAIQWGYTSMLWWTPSYQQGGGPSFDQIRGFTYYAMRIAEQLISCAIPAFLFVSGYFVAAVAGRNQTVGWSTIRSRIKNLLVPYLFWSLLILFGLYLQGQGSSPVQILRRLAFGGASPPYYYVPLVCQLYLMSPLLVPLARKRAKLLLGVAALVQLSAVALSDLQILGIQSATLRRLFPLTRSWFFPAHCFWFVLGIVTGFHLPRVKEWAIRHRWGILAMAGITPILALVEWELLVRGSGQASLSPRVTVLDNFYYLACLLVFLGFEPISLPLSRRFSQLGTDSFGIYLTHAPIQEFVARFLHHLTPALVTWQAAFLPVLLASGLAGPLLLMSIVKRSKARWFYQHLFG